MIAFLFWFALAVIIYVYAGFAVIAAIFARLRNRQVSKRPITPPVSLIIPAYNEEASIAGKLDNVLTLDYPPDQLEIIVASDGSDDATESIVSRYAHQGIRLLAFPRRGKIFAMNDAVEQSSGEIIVFSDATSIFEKQALRQLVSNFADPEVGGASGRMIYARHANRDSSGQGEKLYWSYAVWLKQMKSLSGSIVSASGAIHAIRRGLYQPPADTATTDDFAISTAVVEQGYRLVFDSEACAYEEPAPAAENEFGRKVRMMNRGLRGVILRRRLLNPFRFGFYSLSLFSQKVLRRLVPFFLLILFVSSFLISARGGIYFVAFIAQALFYLSAVFGYLIRRSALGRFKFFYIPFFYCLANAAAFVAVIRLIAGKRVEQWQPHR
ncbi:MAG TPA: glycosyltransferase family 2 protein [Anaerolineales bacterium]|nr:glycosyltransferase family 2 protein [Anaerolineales bacterium]